MTRQATKRIPATEAKTHFGQIVQQVAATGQPVIIQNRGDDQAVLISLDDFQKLSSVEGMSPVSERERVRAALRAAGLLSEPTSEMRERAEEYDTRHSPEQQEKILAELRSLHLEPSVSKVILEGRAWRPGSEWDKEE